jgi:hypothetical protein
LDLILNAIILRVSNVGGRTSSDFKAECRVRTLVVSQWRSTTVKGEKSLQRKRKGQAVEGLQLHMLNVQGTTIFYHETGQT